MKELSVIMPSYLGEYDGCASDRENKFVRAVHSFLENTLKEKELIVVSDNCYMTSNLLHDNFREHIMNGTIKLYEFPKKQKLFSGSLRSKGIELASGKYISYLDSDDILGKNHLSTILSQIKSNDLDWGYFNDYLNTDAGLIPKKVELKKDSIGTSSIIHKKHKKINWDKCDGYGHDFMFIQKLMKWSSKHDKLYGGTYIICHIPNQIDK
jgi:glycosyltransferase involved in cell wall biosynthesis